MKKGSTRICQSGQAHNRKERPVPIRRDRSQQRPRRGFSLVEGVVGTLIFLIIVTGAMKLHTQANLPRQGMIRDFAIAMNICERVLNALAADVIAGEPPPVTPTDVPAQDITAAVLERFGEEQFMEIFSGGIGRNSTELTTNFKALLTARDIGENLGSDLINSRDRYFYLKLTCEWGLTARHSYSLETYVYRR